MTRLLLLVVALSIPSVSLARMCWDATGMRQVPCERPVPTKADLEASQKAIRDYEAKIKLEEMERERKRNAHKKPQ